MAFIKKKGIIGYAVQLKKSKSIYFGIWKTIFLSWLKRWQRKKGLPGEGFPSILDQIGHGVTVGSPTVWGPQGIPAPYA